MRMDWQYHLDLRSAPGHHHSAWKTTLISCPGHCLAMIATGVSHYPLWYTSSLSCYNTQRCYLEQLLIPDTLWCHSELLQQVQVLVHCPKLSQTLSIKSIIVTSSFEWSSLLPHLTLEEQFSIFIIIAWQLIKSRGGDDFCSVNLTNIKIGSNLL